MPLQEELQEEMDHLKEEEKEDEALRTLLVNPEQLVKRIASETAKQAKSSTSGKLAIVLATLLLAINNIAIGWLQGEQVLTEDVLLTIMTGLALVLMLQILFRLDGYVQLRFRKKDIELDIKSLEVVEGEAQIRVKEMQDKQAIMQKSMVQQRLQAQSDMKFKQDMELRVPLYQEAQQNMMEFFARDDILEVLKVPPTFVEAVKKMDDILFQRADIDVGMSELARTMSKILQRYETLQYQVKETATLLDQVVQQQAVHVVKYRELEINQHTIQNQLEGISNSMQNMMMVIDSRLPAKVVTEEENVKVTMTVNAPDLQSDIDDLVDELVKKKEETKSSSPPEGDLNPPPV